MFNINEMDADDLIGEAIDLTRQIGAMSRAAHLLADTYVHEHVALEALEGQSMAIWQTQEHVMQLLEKLLKDHT